MKNLLLILFALGFSGSAQAHPGVGIVEDSKGNVFYTDLSQVWKISPDGKKTIVVPRVHTHELFIDDSDNLFGEHLWYNGEQKNTWSHYVWKYSAAGAFEKVIPDKEGFMENYSFVRDHYGRMYWAEGSKPCQHVVRKNADNSVTKLGNYCFENIRKIEALPDGSVALIDFQDVKRIDKEGRMTVVASKIADKTWTKSTVSNQHSVMGIWADKQGSLFTCVDRSVRKFNPDGKEEVAFKTSFPWSPSGGMVDAQGNLWILEYSITNSVRVERLAKDKTIKTF
jgi:hypothetical protein